MNSSKTLADFTHACVPPEELYIHAIQLGNGYKADEIFKKDSKLESFVGTRCIISEEEHSGIIAVIKQVKQKQNKQDLDSWVVELDIYYRPYIDNSTIAAMMGKRRERGHILDNVEDPQFAYMDPHFFYKNNSLFELMVDATDVRFQNRPDITCMVPRLSETRTELFHLFKGY